MIKGIGIDLVDKYRFKNLIKKFDNKIALKLLSDFEYSEYTNVTNKADYLSKKFAAKEALSKALGTGLYRDGIFPRDITIEHDSFGKPFFNISNKINNKLIKKYKNLQLSISDTNNQSIAFVIIET
tara:strand:- start:3261 stop:3638 length:378 start_codon:yes stop_codon:yes gene_type:complete